MLEVVGGVCPRCAGVPLRNRGLPSDKVFFFSFIDGMSELGSGEPTRRADDLQTATRRGFVATFKGTRNVTLQVPPRRLFVTRVGLCVSHLSYQSVCPFRDARYLTQSFSVVIFLRVSLRGLFAIAFTNVNCKSVRSRFLAKLCVVQAGRRDTVARENVTRSVARKRGQFLNRMAMDPANRVVVLGVEGL